MDWLCGGLKMLRAYQGDDGRGLGLPWTKSFRHSLNALVLMRTSLIFINCNLRCRWFIFGFAVSGLRISLWSRSEEQSVFDAQNGWSECRGGQQGLEFESENNVDVPRANGAKISCGSLFVDWIGKREWFSCDWNWIWLASLIIFYDYYYCHFDEAIDELSVPLVRLYL